MLYSLLWIEISLDGSDGNVSNYPGSFWLPFLDGFEDFELVEIDAEYFPFEWLRDDIISFELSTDLNFRLGIKNRVSIIDLRSCKIK